MTSNRKKIKSTKTFGTSIIKNYSKIISKTERSRKKKVDRIFDYFMWFYVTEGNLPDLLPSRSGDVHEEFLMGESYSLVRNLLQIIITDFNEIIITTLVGAYGSTARTLRSTLETTLRIFSALVDKSILTGKEDDKNKAMCGHEFRHKLFRSEFYNRMKGDEQKILDRWIHAEKFNFENKAMSGIHYMMNKLDDRVFGPIDFSQKHDTKKIISYIYSQLSNYSHTGAWHFDYATDGKPQIMKFKKDEFDVIFNLLMLTTDIIAYLVILAILYDLGFIEKYRKSYLEGLRKELNPIMDANDGVGFFLTQRLLNHSAGKISYLQLPDNINHNKIQHY